MNATITQALERLSAAGITLEARGADLDVAYQADPTEEQWSWLARNKAALLEALRTPAPASPAPAPQAAPAPPPPDSLSPEDQAAANELIEERAAIQEHDGGLSRHQAETEAKAALRVYYYRLSDRPASWLTMIAPGRDLDQAGDDLRLKFPGRLLEVAEYQPRRAAA
ncbi:hypothetical protein U5801_01930 [Lamprobacter modestohalophilus]|uniref:hypothetical protein n=1 Tax=Lamprobacter modestohalophilus TaxID=1064514 RepID=UPI002ADEAD99|nr:hypothetical protein [Lamprobacter modestohalophilus]MEA1048583.1 hypothetical protein [Lamprobacter modestohalophilus]